MKKFFLVLGMAMLIATTVSAVGENAGEIGVSTLGSINWDSPSLGQMKTVIFAINISGGSDGCGYYTITMWGDGTAGSNTVKHEQAGTPLTAGQNSPHVFGINVKRNKLAITGFCVWGPDMQVPVKVNLISLPSPRFTPVRIISSIPR